MLRRRSGQLPETTAVHVVTDLGGRRIGSGGSTLLVLKYLAEQLARRGSLRDAFAGKRIFVLHAGGDSKRMPAYAAQGKLFTPLPTPAAAGQIPTLFDLLLANLERLPRPHDGHLLIAAGDVLLTFNPAEADFSRPGVTGVAYPDHTDRAARHGVYVRRRCRAMSSISCKNRTSTNCGGAARSTGWAVLSSIPA